MRERGGGGELSKSSGISCKFHLLRLIKYTAVGVKLLRICGCLFQLFHSRPTYVLFLFFSSFLFLRAIVLLIQTEYYSYCSSLLSHASRYISQAGKLNLARGERERERERESYDSRGIRRFFFFFLLFFSSRGLGFNFEMKFWGNLYNIILLRPFYFSIFCLISKLMESRGWYKSIPFQINFTLSMTGINARLISFFFSFKDCES